MFGRTVPGPLQLVKSAWLQETYFSSAKQNVVEFILNIRKRLRHALDLASTHADRERSKAKVWCDRRTRLRTFRPGDKILVLMPMPGKPLHAKYHGPYTVEQQLGPVDYVICTPDRRKTKMVCHVNLLKPYHKRESGGSFHFLGSGKHRLLRRSSLPPTSTTLQASRVAGLY